MRKMRKFIALAITAIMIIATGIVGFAAGGTANLTVNLIKPLEEGESVEVYPIKLMDLNIEGEEYKYTINSTYREAIKGSLESTVTEDTQIISELRTMENNGKEAKNFSKKLKDKIVANEEELNKNIKSTITSKGQQGVTFNNLEYGYYIVIAKGKTEYQTALVVLDGKVTNGTPGNTATGGNETIVLKGEELIITKKADKDSAEIGEKVNYTVETEVPAEGTTNFVLTDTLSKGLSYVKENNIVKLNIKIYNDNTEKKSVEREASVSVVGNENLESINIDLNEFVAGKQIDNYTIAEGDKIVITYSAKVNKNAVIVNTNTVKYGNETDVTAIVNTYPLQIKKLMEKQENCYQEQSLNYARIVKVRI